MFFKKFLPALVLSISLAFAPTAIADDDEVDDDDAWELDDDHTWGSDDDDYTTHSVPDGGATAGMLGITLVCMALAGRKFMRR